MCMLLPAAEDSLKGPPLLLVFYTASLFLRVPLVRSTNGYHLYPPNPKENIARFCEPKLITSALSAFKMLEHSLFFNQSKSGKALLAHILGVWSSCLN